MRRRREPVDNAKGSPIGDDHQEAGQQMKSDIAKESFPFHGKAEREPRHGRQEQQPKRPIRPAYANGLPP